MRCIFVMTLLAILALQPLSQAQNWDIALLRTINLDRNQHLDGFFKICSNSVTPAVIGTPSLLAALGIAKGDSGLVGRAIFIGSGYLISAALTEGLKYGVNRTRPFVSYKDIVPLSDGGGPSFPSGHTSAAFAVATGLWMDYRHWYVAVPAFGWASLVAYSRLDLGVHYPSDVAAGIVVGVGSAYLNKVLTKWLIRKQGGQQKLLFDAE